MSEREDNMDQWAAKVGPSTKLNEPDAPDFTPPTRAPRPKGAVKTGNEVTAAAALEVLCNLNTFLAMGFMAAMMPQSGSAISAYEPAFRELALPALIADPILCSKILKLSSTSGVMGLFMAYAGMGMAVMPIAVKEKSNLTNFLGSRKKAKDDN